MDYGALIRQAWATTWRNRFLWVLALFAGGTVGVGGRGWFGWRGPAPRWGRMDDGQALSDIGPLRAWRTDETWRMPDIFDRTQATVRDTVQSMVAWSVAHLGLIAAGVALTAMFVLGLIVLALIARGGMAEATVDLANGRRSSLGRAWRTGTRLVWRYAGLWLLLAGIAVAIAAVVGGIVAAGVGVAAVTGAPRVIALLGALVAIPLALIGIVGAVGLSVTVAYAERAIYAEDAGPIAALRAGWRTLRANVGASALLWLINVAIAIGIGIVGAMVGLILVAMLGGAGLAIWAAAGWSAPLIAYGALGVLALVAVMLTAGAMANAFFWNFWTLAYVRLSGSPAPLMPA